MDDLRNLREAVAQLTQAQKNVQNALESAEKAYLHRFGETLRAAREQAGLTQQELAELAGLVRTSIVNMEAGKQDTTIGTLMRLSVAVRVQPSNLLPHADDNAPAG